MDNTAKSLLNINIRQAIARVDCALIVLDGGISKMHGYTCNTSKDYDDIQRVKNTMIKINDALIRSIM